MPWWKTIDSHCLIAAILFIISDIIALFGLVIATTRRDHVTSIQQLYDLEPTFIQGEWDWSANYNHVNLSYEIINAFAWFVFSIPSTFCLTISIYYDVCEFAIVIESLQRHFRSLYLINPLFIIIGYITFSLSH